MSVKNSCAAVFCKYKWRLQYYAILLNSLIILIANFYLMIQHDAANLKLFSCIGHTGFVFHFKTKERWLISRVWMDSVIRQPCYDAFAPWTGTKLRRLVRMKTLPRLTIPLRQYSQKAASPITSTDSDLSPLNFTVPLSSTPQALFSSAYLDPPQHLSNFNHSSYREIGDPGQRRQRTRRMERLSADTTGNRAHR